MVVQASVTGARVVASSVKTTGKVARISTQKGQTRGGRVADTRSSPRDLNRGRRAAQHEDAHVSQQRQINTARYRGAKALVDTLGDGKKGLQKAKVLRRSFFIAYSLSLPYLVQVLFVCLFIYGFGAGMALADGDISFANAVNFIVDTAFGVHTILGLGWLGASLTAAVSMFVAVLLYSGSGAHIFRGSNLITFICCLTACFVPFFFFFPWVFVWIFVVARNSLST